MRSKEIKRQSFDRGDPDPLSDARNRCRVSTTLLLLLLARGFISINSFFIRGECEKGLLANGFQPLRIFALFWASICVKLGYHARRARPGETGLVDLVFPVYFITFCLPLVPFLHYWFDSFKPSMWTKSDWWTESFRHGLLSLSLCFSYCYWDPFHIQ